MHSTSKFMSPAAIIFFLAVSASAQMMPGDIGNQPYPGGGMSSQPLKTLSDQLMHHDIVRDVAGRANGSNENGEMYFDISTGYARGDFGTPVTTDLFTITPTFGVISERSDFSISLPYVSLADEISREVTVRSGPGDLILRAGAVLIPELTNGFSLGGSAALKLPTASKKKGLGTGEPDYGFFLSSRRRFAHLKITVMAGYIVTGNMPGFGLRDVYLYGLSIGKTMGKKSIQACYEGRRSTVPGAPEPHELNFGFYQQMSDRYTFKSGFFAGVNNGGPDFGAYAGLIRWF